MTGIVPLSQEFAHLRKFKNDDPVCSSYVESLVLSMSRWVEWCDQPCIRRLAMSWQDTEHSVVTVHVCSVLLFQLVPQMLVKAFVGHTFSWCVRAMGIQHHCMAHRSFPPGHHGFQDYCTQVMSLYIHDAHFNVMHTCIYDPPTKHYEVPCDHVCLKFDDVHTNTPTTPLAWLPRLTKWVYRVGGVINGMACVNRPLSGGRGIEAVSQLFLNEPVSVVL